MLDGGIPSQHYDGYRRIPLLKSLNETDGISVRQHVVKNGQVGHRSFPEFLRFGAARPGSNVHVLGIEDLTYGAQELALVIDQKNLRFLHLVRHPDQGTATSLPLKKLTFLNEW